MVGIDTPEDAYPSLGTAGALGWGFLTAIATGPFSTLLFILVLFAGDPSELIDDPMAVLGSIVSLLAVGSIVVPVFAVILAWLPISLVGWLTHKAGGRWPILRRRAAWVCMGAVAGGILLALPGGAVDDVITDPDPANWERLRDMAAFGAGCGIFAALFFRWLVARNAP